MDPDADKPLETLFEGRWLRIRRRGRWEYVERVHAGGMAVIIVAATPERKLLFVEQERIPVEGPTIEMPAGLVGDEEGGETLEAAASRELLEETGYESDEWVYLGRCAPEPSKHTNYAYFYVARNARRVGEQDLDDSESLALHLYRPSEVLRMADDGEIVHGTQLTAVFWANRKGYLQPEGE